MNDSSQKSALTPDSNINQSRRYSDPALLLVTAQYTNTVYARAARNPAYLSAKTMASLNRAVKAANTRVTNAVTKIGIRRARARLFYATAMRDAFTIVLRQTQPSASALRMPNPTNPSRKYAAPDTAGKLAAWRHEIRWRTRKVNSLNDTYQELREQYERRRQTYEQARARLAILVDDQEAELALRRQANPNARTPRALATHLTGMKDIVRIARRELREIEGSYQAVRRKVQQGKERIELLRARIEQYEIIL